VPPSSEMVPLSTVLSMVDTAVSSVMVALNAVMVTGSVGGTSVDPNLGSALIRTLLSAPAAGAVAPVVSAVGGGAIVTGPVDALGVTYSVTTTVWSALLLHAVTNSATAVNRVARNAWQAGLLVVVRSDSVVESRRREVAKGRWTETTGRQDWSLGHRRRVASG